MEFVHQEIIENVDPDHDLLIIVSGFEERVKGIIDLTKNLKQSAEILNLVYTHTYQTDLNDANSKNKIQLENYFKLNFSKYFEFEITFLEPKETYEKLVKFLDSIIGYRRISICFDMSGCFDGLIPNLFLYLRNNRRVPKCEIVYTAPTKYILPDILGKTASFEKIRKSKLSSGLTLMEPHEMYRGFYMPTYKQKIIFFAGFENNKVSAVSNRFENAEKIVCFAKGDPEDPNYKISRLLHKKLINRYDFEQYDIELLDFQKIYSFLKDLISNEPSYNYIIACFGSKIQLLASSYLIHMYPNTQLYRVTYKRYSPFYFSKGIGKSISMKFAE